MIYDFKPGRHFPVSAQVAGETLEQIRREVISREGGIGYRQKHVVEASRPEDAPLHPCFTWNDWEAAEKCREDEAQRLMNSVVEVSVQSETTEQKRTISYVAIKDEDRGHQYVRTVEAMEQKTLREQVISTCLAVLVGWRRRYAHLHELQEVFEAIDRATAAQAQKVAEQAARPKSKRSKPKAGRRRRLIAAS